MIAWARALRGMDRQSPEAQAPLKGCSRLCFRVLIDPCGQAEGLPPLCDQTRKSVSANRASSSIHCSPSWNPACRPSDKTCSGSYL